MNLWLDDIRPAPEGWVHVKTIQDAKECLMTGKVEYASLDHDLGACDECMMDENNWGGAMPHCSHVGTGYDLVQWMTETKCWPKFEPIVHSANPVGAKRMRDDIDLHYHRVDAICP